MIGCFMNVIYRVIVPVFFLTLSLIMMPAELSNQAALAHMGFPADPSAALQQAFEAYVATHIQELITGTTKETTAAKKQLIADMTAALDNGADPDLMIEGKPIIFQAVHHHVPEVALLLLDYDVDVIFDNDSLLSEYLKAGGTDQALILKMLGTGLDPAYADNEGMNALMYAVQNPIISAAVIRLLHENGAEVSDTDNKGLNVLMHALMTPFVRFDIVRLLVDYLDEDGGDINAQGLMGMTALYLAQHYFPHPNPNIVKLLVDNGANPNLEPSLDYDNSRFNLTPQEQEFLAHQRSYYKKRTKELTHEFGQEAPSGFAPIMGIIGEYAAGEPKPDKGDSKEGEKKSKKKKKPRTAGSTQPASEEEESESESD